jgi:hypothetical protein
MGAHDFLFWMSMATAAGAVCLVAMLKAARGPDPDQTRRIGSGHRSPDHAQVRIHRS